jgi:hypothetical protein
VWAAIVVSSALRIWAITSSYFWQDDWIHIWRAWNQPASTFLIQDWNGHIEPLSWGYYWFITHLDPQQWWAAALYLCALAVAMPIAWWWVVRTLGGVTWLSAAVTVAFAFWPGLLVPQVWLATGLEMAALLFAILTVGAIAQEGRRRYLALVFMGIGALFNERVLYAVPLAVLALLMFSDQRGVRRRVKAVASTHGRILSALLAEAVVVVGILAVLGADSADDGELTVAHFFQGLWYGGPEGVFKSLLGLDMFWPDLRVTTPLGPPSWAVVIVLAALGCIIALGWRRDRRQAVFCVAAVLAMFAVEVLLVAALRTEFLGIALLRDPRYTFATGILVLLSVLSFSRTSQDTDERPPTMGVLAVLAIVVLGSVSMVRIGSILDSGPAKAWLDTARSAFTAPDAPALVSTPSPPPMLAGYFLGETDDGHVYDLGTTRTLLDVGPDLPRISDAAVLPISAGLNGAPAGVDLFPVTSTTPAGFGGDCSITVEEGQWQEVPMTPVQLSNPAVAVDYLAERDTTLVIATDDWQTAVAVPAGFRSVWVFPPAGPFDGVRVQAIGSPGRVCIGAAKAGAPQAVTLP